MMADAVWKTINEAHVADLAGFVASATVQGHRLVDIGTDSIQVGRRTEFVTVVALRRPGKGGRVLYRRSIVSRIDSLRARLLREAWLSVKVALELNAILADDSELTVHVDANPVARYRSSRYVQELAAMVVSQGFRLALKPSAWAATHAADHIARRKHLLGQMPVYPVAGFESGL
jgi:predicted RNase H-related nuclease YkuK (DUF458 family)